MLASFESTFINCRLYEPSCLSFGTIIVINPSCKFTVLPFAFVSSVNVALFAIYSPFCSSLFTSTVNVSISLLYPIGASVSVIVIVSVPGSVIAILSILNVPFASVVYSVDCPLFIVTLNFAPCNGFWFSPSCFINCIPYAPVCFSFGTVIVINPFSRLIVLPCGCVLVVNSALLATYFPSLIVFVTFTCSSPITLL